MPIVHKFLDNEITYQNNTLSPRFFDAKNYLVSFCGPIKVTLEGLCDLADVYGPEPFIDGYMLHFIGKFENLSSNESVLLQRFFVTHVNNVIANVTEKRLTQQGDDLFYKGKKLSVSIIAPIDNTKNTGDLNDYMLHMGLNINSSATLDIATLAELQKFDFENLANKILKGFVSEYKGITKASLKTKPIKEDGNLLNLERLMKKLEHFDRKRFESKDEEYTLDDVYNFIALYDHFKDFPLDQKLKVLEKFNTLYFKNNNLTFILEDLDDRSAMAIWEATALRMLDIKRYERY